MYEMFSGYFNEIRDKQLAAIRRDSESNKSVEEIGRRLEVAAFHHPKREWYDHNGQPDKMISREEKKARAGALAQARRRAQDEANKEAQEAAKAFKEYEEEGGVRLEDLKKEISQEP